MESMEGTIPSMGDVDKLPTKLSPSRASDFQTCPKQFYFKTIEKLPTFNTVENTRGSIAHDALENLFRLPKQERTVAKALEYVEPAWDAMKVGDSYKDLVEPGSPEEGELLNYAREMVSNYFHLEDPTRFDPVGIEEWVNANLGPVRIHGKIDRRDEVDGRIYISDYKTGRLPNPRYISKTFFAMRVYAWAISKMYGQAPYELRLIYLKSTDPDKAIFRERVTQASLMRTEEELHLIWRAIRSAALAQDWPAKPSKLCDWCSFKSICPAFNDGGDG